MAPFNAHRPVANSRGGDRVRAGQSNPFLAYRRSPVTGPLTSNVRRAAKLKTLCITRRPKLIPDTTSLQISVTSGHRPIPPLGYGSWPPALAASPKS
jgi:hypothetical protein